MTNFTFKVTKCTIIIIIRGTVKFSGPVSNCLYYGKLFIIAHLYKIPIALLLFRFGDGTVPKVLSLLLLFHKVVFRVSRLKQTYESRLGILCVYSGYMLQRENFIIKNVFLTTDLMAEVNKLSVVFQFF